MPLPYDDFKKTEKLNSINSPPQEQPKENALQGGMGDAQKLKITSDATKKFKQMYLKMLATRSDAVSENLSEEKPEEHYISLDCKTKTESHSSFIPQKKTFY